MADNVYTFKKWKEFSLEQPNDVFYNSLQNVLENSDLEGDLKHKKENVFKVFSLLITHNYGHLLYELVHLLYYLNTIKVPCYKAMVLKPYKLQKEILTNKNYTDKNQKEIECSIKDKKFRIAFSRIPVLLVLLDFIEEFLGVKEIIELSNNLDKIDDNNKLNLFSNNVSKSLYEFMKDKLPSAHIQNYGHLISEELVKFKNEKFDNLNSHDVDDDFIFNLWVRANTVYDNISLKTYKLVFELCLKYKKAMELSPSITISSGMSENNEHTWYQQKFYGDTNEDNCQWDISSKKFETIANQIVEQNQTLEDGINLFEDLQNRGVNLIQKSEIECLKLFSHYPDFLCQIPLSYIRNNTFSNIQNVLIESERRNNFKKYSDILIQKNNYYLDCLHKNEKLMLHFIRLRSIIFSYLWDNNSNFIIELIDDYLNPKEKDSLKVFVKKYINENPKNLNNLVLNLKEFILNLQINESDFSEFKNKINQFNNFKKGFRRKGLFKNQSTELNKAFCDASKFLNEFIVTIIDFKKNLSSNRDLDTQFIKDFDDFTKVFTLIHGAK